MVFKFVDRVVGKALGAGQIAVEDGLARLERMAGDRAGCRRAVAGEGQKMERWRCPATGLMIC
jgi:hypothetical protein